MELIRQKNGVVHKFICQTSLKVSLQIQTHYLMIEADGGAVFLALKMILKGMSLRGGAEVFRVLNYILYANGCVQQSNTAEN